MSFREIWGVTRMGIKVSAAISPDGSEIAIGVTNTLAYTGVSNNIKLGEARTLAAALVDAAGGPLESKSLFEQIEDSADIDDLEDAVRPIQQILGQRGGGVASIFFDDGNAVDWPTADRQQRLAALRQYVRFEMEMQR